MQITIEEIDLLSRPSRQAFIGLPASLYRSCSGHVGLPDDLVAQNLLTTRRQLRVQGDIAYWLAKRGGKIVGRITAHVDPRAAKIAGDAPHARAGYFGFLDSIDDREVFGLLFGKAEAWLSQRGCIMVQGPFSHSINEECGLMVQGFDAPATLMMPYHPPYAENHLHACGYKGIKNLFAFQHHLTQPASASGQYRESAARAGIKIRHLRMQDYDTDVRHIVNIFNDAWAQNWGFMPLSEEETRHVAISFRSLVDPELVLFAEINDEPVAMMVAVPNLAEAMAGLNSSLLPFDWAKLLWRLKIRKPRSCRLLLMGIRQNIRSGRLAAPLVVEAMLEQLEQRLIRKNYAWIEFSWVLEDNEALLKLIRRRAGSQPSKTYRLYEKPL